MASAGTEGGSLDSGRAAPPSACSAERIALQQPHRLGGVTRSSKRWRGAGTKPRYNAIWQQGAPLFQAGTAAPGISCITGGSPRPTLRQARPATPERQRGRRDPPALNRRTVQGEQVGQIETRLPGTEGCWRRRRYRPSGLWCPRLKWADRDSAGYVTLRFRAADLGHGEAKPKRLGTHHRQSPAGGGWQKIVASVQK